ncbi:polysaccharide deacetylase family protein [Ectothiorhodospira mobilis]|uniref:polysaccharide deacetylase family protein n=1 Tax=Ectothiorhodospira mobilis TaxID=195064 RepID=UPI001EE7B325|nr:polysaccharide deacetylase family protein [Ectothiorhodospira mobilis]MCG5535556.1 polysaccharide deacetylase family protein [Ectothiorhodospira mobilis]
MTPPLAVRMMRPIAGLLAPGGRRARLSILIYHRVRPEPDPMLPGDPDAATFRWQMETVSGLFRVLPLAEAAARLQRGSLPPRAACITFDDGYADNHDVALPILQSLGLPATFFVATGFLDGGMMFNDRILETIRRLSPGLQDLGFLGLGMREIPVEMEARHALAMEAIRAVKHLSGEERSQRAAALQALSPSPLPRDLMMTTAQVRALDAAGMEIGGHTHTHPILARLPGPAAKEEIARGKAILESMLGHRIRVFAYPNGKPGKDYGLEHVGMVRDCGFDAAVATAWGVSTASRDPFQLARFTPWDTTPIPFALRLGRNLLRNSPDQAR